MKMGWESHKPRIGLEIEVADRIDLSPYAIIEKGERGVITAINTDDALLTIRLNTYHGGLARWENDIWVFPNVMEIMDRIRPLG